MRWTQQRRAVYARTNGADADVKSCGPDTPTLVSSERNDPLMTGSRQPGPWGERDISVKTIAQGRPPGFSAEPVVIAVSFFVAGGPRARRAPGLPCALFEFEGPKSVQNSGAIAPRGHRCTSRVVIARRASAEAIQSFLVARFLDCFALLAMTAPMMRENRRWGDEGVCCDVYFVQAQPNIGCEER
jgi:hypothetical protein